MTNNINNLNGYNAINFKSKDKTKEAKAPKCESSECKQAEASSLDALANAGKAQILRPYKYNPKNTQADLKKFEKACAQYADEALDIAFEGINNLAIEKFGK